MILVALLSLILLADAPATSICVSNEVDEVIGVLASQENGERTILNPQDVPSKGELCFSLNSNGNGLVVVQVARKSDHSERSLLTPKCPQIVPGTTVHIVVGQSGRDLTCAAKV